jgi:hypothetical protein
MRLTRSLMAIGLAVGLGEVWAIHAAPTRLAPVLTAPAPVPVVVELFTSEGCSSCPPADAFLIELAAHPIVGEANANLITLSEHVDYWDSQGWRDPFSNSSFTARQTAYAQRSGVGDISTPEMIVDGAIALIGSDRPAALRAITKAASQPKAPLALTWTSAPKPSVTIALAANALTQHASVVLAITEDGLHSSVLRGENAGRSISHASVTRRLDVVGQTSADGSFKLELPVKLDPTWNRRALKVVAFVQATKRQVVAAGTMSVPDGARP